MTVFSEEGGSRRGKVGGSRGGGGRVLRAIILRVLGRRVGERKLEGRGVERLLEEGTRARMRGSGGLGKLIGFSEGVEFIRSLA